MIYLLHGLSQKPKKMADGGVAPANLGTVQGTAGPGSTGFLGLSPSGVPLAPIQQYDYSNMLGTTGANTQQVYGQQQALASMLQGQAAGTSGPSVAQNMLNQATGNNIQNQAALMASQRGAGANTGLIARQAAMQGANAQQQAAGQAATMRSQEQLNAQNALGNLYGTIGQQQGGLFGTTANAINSQNANLVNNYSQANSANAQLAQGNANRNQGILGGLIGGVGSILGLAHGGEVPHYANGTPDGPIGSLVDTTMPQPSIGMLPYQQGMESLTPMPQVEFGQSAPGFNKDYGSAGSSPMSAAGKFLSGFSSGMSNSSNSSQVSAPQMYSNPYLKANTGVMVPGRAQVDGDSEQNDTVHALLSPGEIVVPRTAAQDPEKAAAFAKSVAMRHGKKKRSR